MIKHLLRRIPLIGRLSDQRDRLAEERNHLRAENLQLKNQLESARINGLVGEADRDFFDTENNPSPKIVTHAGLWQFLSDQVNHPDKQVLEIGSRSVVSDALWKQHLPDCSYTGFDVHPGPNVDVVGDAHQLSQYFDRQFDLVFSLAVFEHLAMPWVVAEEIARVLKPGGLVVVETHFSYSMHERP